MPLEYIVSIDIGIKNLAICLFEKEDIDEGTRPKIHEWVVLNISNSTPEHDGKPVINKPKCSLCKHVAKYRILVDSLPIDYCMKHSKNSTDYILPCGEYTYQKIKKYKLTDLVRVLSPWVKSTTPLPKTKKDWVDLYTSITLMPLIDNECHDIITCSEVSLIDVSRFLTQKMDTLLSTYMPNITTVLLENQISPIANRMKSVQSMITQYFVMRGISTNTIDVIYVSSTHKLDGISVDTYSERKKAGISKCLGILSDTPKWIEYVSKHKKKDDLADCYLQGHWYINQSK